MLYNPNMNEIGILSKLKEQLGISRITNLPLGLSNNCYLLDNSYIVKITYDSNFPLLFDTVLLKDAYNNGLSPEILTEFSTEQYITGVYQEDLRSSPINELDNNQLHKLTKSIKTYQQLKAEKLEHILIPELIKRYCSHCQNSYSKYLPLLPPLPLEKEVVNVHLDLVEGNILFDRNGELKLIDYDLSIRGDPNLDLVSLISENEIHESTRDIIISSYFENDSVKIKSFHENLPLYIAYFDLLWYSWALAREKKAPTEKRAIYQKIALMKKTRFDKFLLSLGLL